MTQEITPGMPTTRRYTKDEKDHAVRLVFELRKERGTTQGTLVVSLTSWGTARNLCAAGLPRLRAMPGM